MNTAEQCGTCGLSDVRWSEGRKGIDRHEGAKRSCRFPCASRNCDHLDCAEARGVDELIRVASKLGIVIVDDGDAILNPDVLNSIEEHEEQDEMAKANSKTKKTLKKTTKKSTRAKNKAKAKSTKKAAKKKLTDAEYKALVKKLPKKKYCPRCEKKRDAKNFYTFKRVAGPKLSTYCKPCYREANKEWKAAQDG